MFKGKSEAFTAFKDALFVEAEQIIQNRAADVEDLIREQLSSGLDGNENKLTPSYTADPFFQSKEAGGWYNNAEGYKKWKMNITPPTASYLGFSPRDADTPNLYIMGNFHDSIRAQPVNGGIKVVSQGFTDAGDILGKYGEQIFKISKSAQRHFVKHPFRSDFEKFLNKYK